MSVEKQKQVETQQTSKEEDSTNSVVKTPLVDALRFYFKLDYDAKGFPVSYPDPI